MSRNWNVHLLNSIRSNALDSFVCVCHARMREYAGLKKPSLLGVIFQLQNHFNNFGKNTYITACSMNNTIWYSISEYEVLDAMGGIICVLEFHAWTHVHRYEFENFVAQRA